MSWWQQVTCRFIAAFRQARQAERLRLASRPSLWFLKAKSEEDALSRWDDAQAKWPSIQLDAEVHHAWHAMCTLKHVKLNMARTIMTAFLAAS